MQKERIGLVDIAVIRIPRISNFTDFMLLENAPGVNLRYVKNPRELENPDMVILPGTKKYDGRSEMVKTERNGSEDSKGACRRLCGLGNLRRLSDAGAVAQ